MSINLFPSTNLYLLSFPLEWRNKLIGDRTEITYIWFPRHTHHCHKQLCPKVWRERGSCVLTICGECGDRAVPVRLARLPWSLAASAPLWWAADTSNIISLEETNFPTISPKTENKEGQKFPSHWRPDWPIGMPGSLPLRALCRCRCHWRKWMDASHTAVLAVTLAFPIFGLHFLLQKSKQL